MPKKRLGRVQVHSYVVDLDNEEMVDHAKECLYDDLSHHSELWSFIDVVEDPNADEGEIPEFLTEDHEDWVE